MAQETNKAKMTKSQLHTGMTEELVALFEGYKNVNKQLKADVFELIDSYLKPQRNTSANPPKEIDGVKHYWCNKHERYEPEQDMMISKGKSKGHCRAAGIKWSRTHALIGRKETEVVSLVRAGNFEEAGTLTAEVDELKSKYNLPSFYDYEADWEEYSKLKNDTEAE